MSSASASLSWRSVKGLLRKPLAPFSIASTAVALSASAEITRMRTSGFSWTIFSMHSMPSICGIVRSIVTRSGSVRLNRSSASTPLAAAPTTSSSSNCCERSMRRRTMFESSTIRSRSGRFAPRRSSDGTVRLLRDGQCDLEAGELPRIRGHTDLAAQQRDAAGHHVHADPAAGIHRDLLLRGEAGAEDQPHGSATVHAFRFLGGDQVLAQCGRLQLLRSDAVAVVFEGELVAVIPLLEFHADGARLLFRMHAAQVDRLDAVNG